MRRFLNGLLPLLVMLAMSLVIRRFSQTPWSLAAGVASYGLLLLSLLPQRRELKPWLAAPRWPDVVPVPLPALALMLWGISATLQTLIVRSGWIPADAQGLGALHLNLTDLLVRLGLLSLLISEELLNVSTLSWTGDTRWAQRLPEPLRAAVVVTITALLFGLMHGLTYNPASAVLVFAGHLPYLLATWKTRNLWPALAGHILNNAAVFAALYSPSARTVVLGVAFGVTALWLVVAFRSSPGTAREPSRRPR